MKYQGPCEVLIIGLGLPGSVDASKKRWVRSTGYGAKRHADRWLARGWERVSVAVYSASTGKTVEIYNATRHN